MKKIFSISVVFISSFLLCNEPKIVKITGAIVAPWVKGELCIGYWYNQEKIKSCRPIHVNQDYIFTIPYRLGHIKVYRSFAKQCKLTPRGRKKCRTIKGRFNTKKQTTKLNLTYDHSRITKFYTIPPQEPTSIYGYPRRNPSIIFRNAQIDNPTAFS